jgi:site-specific recombinase XerD
LDELDKAARLAAAEKSTATRRAYAADFTIFSSWCRNRGVTPLPAEPATVSAFLAFEVGLGRRPSTLGRRLAAIQFWHLTAGHEAPTTAEVVRATLRGIRRVFGTARHRKAPATAGLAKAMARATPATLVGLRDRALILLGFAGALRRSELVGLDVADLMRTEKGLLVTIRRSKTDQEAEGITIAIPHGGEDCPVGATRTWLRAAAITEGAAFRPIGRSGKVSDRRLCDRAVTNAIKRYAKQTGLDPKMFSAHSLRSGFLTSAAANGASIFKMMDVSRHKSIDTLRAYVRDAELFNDHAGAGLL